MANPLNKISNHFFSSQEALNIALGTMAPSKQATAAAATVNGVVVGFQAINAQMELNITLTNGETITGFLASKDVEYHLPCTAITVTDLDPATSGTNGVLLYWDFPRI